MAWGSRAIAWPPMISSLHWTRPTMAISLPRTLHYRNISHDVLYRLVIAYPVHCLYVWLKIILSQKYFHASEAGDGLVAIEVYAIAATFLLKAIHSISCFMFPDILVSCSGQDPPICCLTLPLQYTTDGQYLRCANSWQHWACSFGGNLDLAIWRTFQADSRNARWPQRGQHLKSWLRVIFTYHGQPRGATCTLHGSTSGVFSFWCRSCSKKWSRPCNICAGTGGCWQALQVLHKDQR